VICAPLASVTTPIDNLPDDLESLKRLLVAEHAARIDAEAKAASAEAAAARAAANVSSASALIAHLKLAIEKMRRELYGSRSERGRKLLDQMELELEDLEAAASPLALGALVAGTWHQTKTPGAKRRNTLAAAFVPVNPPDVYLLPLPCHRGPVGGMNFFTSISPARCRMV
jgi:transposase